MADKWDVFVTLLNYIPQDSNFDRAVHNIYKSWHCKQQGSVLRELPRSERFITESIIRCHIEALTGHCFPKARPNWLRNPVTGRSLELDMYCHELSLALEYYGAHHYHFTPHFHKTHTAFLQQQRLDRQKEHTCVANGVRLIRIPYSVFESLQLTDAMFIS